MARADREPLSERRIPDGTDFLFAADIAAITPETLIARTTAPKPLVAAHAELAERQRRPSNAVWRAGARQAVSICSCRPLGGLHFDADTFTDATPPIAEACASSGSVASFCAEHNGFFAQRPKAGQAELWRRSSYFIASPPTVRRRCGCSRCRSATSR